MPQRPKPPTMTVMPSQMCPALARSASAAAAVSYCFEVGILEVLGVRVFALAAVRWRWCVGELACVGCFDEDEDGEAAAGGHGSGECDARRVDASAGELGEVCECGIDCALAGRAERGA